MKEYIDESKSNLYEILVSKIAWGKTEETVLLEIFIDSPNLCCTSIVLNAKDTATYPCALQPYTAVGEVKYVHKCIIPSLRVKSAIGAQKGKQDHCSLRVKSKDFKKEAPRLLSLD